MRGQWNKGANVRQMDWLAECINAHSLLSCFSVCACAFLSIQMADEINEQMAQPIGPQMDEDELNAELEEMENELMDSQLLAAPDVPVATVKCEANMMHTRDLRLSARLLPSITHCGLCACFLRSPSSSSHRLLHCRRSTRPSCRRFSCGRRSCPRASAPGRHGRRRRRACFCIGEQQQREEAQREGAK